MSFRTTNSQRPGVGTSRTHARLPLVNAPPEAPEIKRRQEGSQARCASNLSEVNLCGVSQLDLAAAHARIEQLFADLATLDHRRAELEMRLRFARLLLDLGLPDPSFEALRHDVAQFVHVCTSLAHVMSQRGRV